MYHKMEKLNQVTEREQRQEFNNFSAFYHFIIAILLAGLSYIYPFYKNLSTKIYTTIHEIHLYILNKNFVYNTIISILGLKLIEAD